LKYAGFHFADAGIRGVPGHTRIRSPGRGHERGHPVTPDEIRRRWLACNYTGWALAVFSGVVVATACGSPGAHLNPAVSVAVAIRTGHWQEFATFITAQMAGGFCGAILVYLFYKPHFDATEDGELKRAVFCTSPAIRSPLSNLFNEALATAVLLLIIGAIGAKQFAPAGPAPGLAPYLVAMTVWGIGLGLGGTTGYALNPARPRTSPGPCPFTDSRQSSVRLAVRADPRSWPAARRCSCWILPTLRADLGLLMVLLSFPVARN